MSDDDNVTALPGLPVNPLTVDERRDFCGHDAIRIDAHERTIRCAKCGAMLDAFDYLRSNARTIESAWTAYRDVNRRAREVGERVHALKKEEQRLRARIQRLNAKTGETTLVRRPRDE